jgi:uncharacterized protein (TIGR02246 family)
MDLEQIRREVEEAGRRHYAAAYSGDAEALAPLLGEELVYSHSDGHYEGKAAYIENFVANGRYVEMELTGTHSVERLVVLGDGVVMVRGKQVTNTSGKDGRFKFEDQEACSLDVWVKRDGRWQLIAHHMTLVRSPDAYRRAFAAVYGG